jgi:hypothetical protein
VTFLGAKKTNGEVRRAGPVEQPPPDSSWWGFELRVKNTSKTQRQSMPDVGLVCGNDSPTSAEFLSNPGFIMGEPAYATAMLDAGGTNTGVVPLALPDNATNCRFLVRMDQAHGGGTPLEFLFQ